MEAAADSAADKTVLPTAAVSLEQMDVTVEQLDRFWAVNVNGLLLITTAAQNCAFAVKGLLDQLWEERAVLRERLDAESDGAETDSEQARADVLRQERKSLRR